VAISMSCLCIRQIIHVGREKSRVDETSLLMTPGAVTNFVANFNVLTKIVILIIVNGR
jgi:hypothetical protein